MYRGFLLTLCVATGASAHAATFRVAGDDRYARGISANEFDAIAQPGDRIEFHADTAASAPLGREGVEYFIADGVRLTAEDWHLFGTDASYTITGGGILGATGSGFVFFGGIQNPTIDVWCMAVESLGSPGQPIVDMDSGQLTFHAGTVAGVIDSFGVSVRFMPGVNHQGAIASGTHPHLVIPEPSSAWLLCLALLGNLRRRVMQ